MMYVYLALLILSLLCLVYFLYSLEINRKLNIKKRQFAIRPSRNKFFVIFCVNVLFLIVFGGLFVQSLIARKESPVISSDESESTGKAVSRTTPLTILSNNIEYKDYNNCKQDKNAYYYYADGKIYRYDYNENETISIDSVSDRFELVKDDVIVYYETESEGLVYTHLDFYNKDDFKINKEIIIDGRLVECFSMSGFFLGSTINVIVETFNVQSINNICYQEIVYSYDEEDVVKTEHDKVYINEALKPQQHNYDRLILHLQYNYRSESLKVKAICLSDYYLTRVDGYLYIFCNLYGKSSYDNESFILEYNPYDLSINDYHIYSNIFYSSPVVYQDGIKTYITFVTYNIDYANYQLCTIDNNLDIVEVKDIYLDTSNRVPGKREKNLIIMDNEIVKVDNILYYDNNKLISYDVDKENNVIVINEYLLADRMFNKYNIKLDNSFDEAEVLDIKHIKGNYFVICKIDDKEMYCHYLENKDKDDASEDKKDGFIISAIDVIAGEVSDNSYYIVNDELLTIHINEENEEIITIKKIKQLINEETESGE